MTHPQEKVLFLCHQNRILQKAKDDFQGIIGGDPALYGFYHGDAKDRDAKYLFGSFRTLAERYGEFDSREFGYVVVDESHHSHADTFGPVIKHFRPGFLLGMTATPDRMDLQDIREFYGEEVFSLPLEDALANGLLSKVDYRLIADDLVKVGEIENPYRLTVEELNRRVFVPKRDEEILRIVNERIAKAGITNPKILTFCSGIAHANRIVDLMPNARPVHSEVSDKNQDNHIDAFKRGEVSNLVTVNQFNEGVDFPDINVLLFLRPTQSQNVFYQQLGRGLRKVEGKDKVLVLDFAGNCERIEMVHGLNKRVMEETARLKPTMEAEQEDKTTKVFDFGKFEFTQQVIEILDVIGKAREGYTKENLIALLKAEAKSLGRTPTAEDIRVACRERGVAGRDYFIAAFGSWNKALEAAGFKLNCVPRKFDKTTLIQQLKAMNEILGHTPTIADMNIASREGKTANPKAFATAFGSWNNALTAAGLRLNDSISYEKPLLIEQLRSLREELGKIPTLDDVIQNSKEKKGAGYRAYVHAFGSYTSALRAAGLMEVKINERKRLLVQQLQALKEELGYVPTIEDIKVASKEKKTASPAGYAKAFGSFSAALEAAGFESRFVVYEKPVLIQLLKDVKEYLGRTPTAKDVDNYSKEHKTASSGPFRSNFGTFNKALQAAGLEVQRIRNFYTKPDLIKQIRDMKEELGRVPTGRDVHHLSKKRKMASYHAFNNAFGSWSNAVKEAGFQSNKLPPL